MDERVLRGFRVENEGSLMQIAGSIGAKAHLAYISNEESAVRGYVFYSGEEITDWETDFTHPNAQILGKLVERRVFPVSKLSYGLFWSEKVYLKTWPSAENSVLFPTMTLNHSKKLVSIKYFSAVDASFVLRKLDFKLKDMQLSGLKLQVSKKEVVTVHIPLVRCPISSVSTAGGEKLHYWYCNGVKDPWQVTPAWMFTETDWLWETLAPVSVLKLEFSLKFPVNSDLISTLNAFFTNKIEEIKYTIMQESAKNIRPSISLSDLTNSSLDFSLKYLLLCLLSHGYTTIFHLPRDFLYQLQEIPLEKAKFALKYSYLSSKLHVFRPKDFPSHFQFQLFRYDSEDIFERDLDCQVLCRILVTPSTVYFKLPSKELSNRVTRRYWEYLDRFLRVSLVDERLSTLTNVTLGVRKRLERRFLPRWEVLGREYELMSFSSSQLRSSSYWMFANCPDLSVSDIWHWLGDFSNNKSVSKYAARIGLCFSNSQLCGSLSPKELVPIDEIQHNHNKLSDGAGTISLELLTEVAEISDNMKKLSFGRSIQIRLGGIKGVVSVDPRLTGRKLCFRPSMHKFHSTHREIELLNWAEYRYGYLNRQIILLLSTLDIPDDAFLSLQDSYMTNIRKIFTNSQDLKRNIAIANKDETGGSEMIDVIVDMLSKGYSAGNDLFMYAVAQALYVRMTMELRQRQRILIPESGCLMGVMDEFGVLEYGEVYVHIKFENNEETEDKEITGKVAVTKNPCFHPGDVRVLRAVSEEEMRERSGQTGLFLWENYVNVVVFPQKGHRSHPNEISGSDLDGDLYTVIWDPSLIPTHSHPPMDYTDSVSGETPPFHMTPELLSEFFFTFISNDNLGIIANSHLAIADYSPDKAKNLICLKLAEMHSTAVDFAKTGVSNQIPRDLKPRKYPDYMKNKGNRENYISESAIGKLFHKAMEIPKAPESDQLYSESEPHPELRNTAEKLLETYVFRVNSIMNMFNIESETEILTGEIAKYSKYYSNQQKRREETRGKLKRLVAELIHEMQEKFEQVKQDRDRELAEECKYVAYAQGKWLGFPWVTAGHQILGRPTSTTRSFL